ncbi:hypothetical protein F900_01860 [Acinetobacter modestus]|uniref:Baseplate structural protein Gp10 C-terminal domain-containing protein n=1 Tax=Acinetobacter modestus TaxID=1776740 RepID=N9N5G4_9GAMM|nr:hypothetical protein [Acinetobacter modestus]ENX00876.1 hypothetical protein F900_01860 [Acinetobacter modestus]
MPVNQFLPFATDEDANVMSQADYAALSARQNGFQLGVASSQQLNKVWRQSSTVSSVLTQFICNHQTGDVLDNGEIPTLLSQLESALINLILPVDTIISSFDPAFNPNTKYAGTTWILHGQGRVAVGLSTQESDATWKKTIGNEFGSDEHPLTIEEGPEHNHNDGDFKKLLIVNGIGTQNSSDATAGEPNLLAEGNKDILPSGEGRPHNNVQPSIVEARWRRTA